MLLKDKISTNGSLVIRMKGTSMGPFIKNGDIAVVKKISPRNVRVGDVLLYHIGDDYFAHRVLKKHGRAPMFALKGDAVNVIDRNVSFEEVIGKVVSITRKTRNFNLQSGEWRVINYFILFYSFGLSLIREIMKKYVRMEVLPVKER